MLLVEEVNKQILKLTKKKKYKHKKKENTFNLLMGLYENSMHGYIIKGGNVGYISNKAKNIHQRIVKPLNLGPAKYKIEIISEPDFAICIDHNIVKIFSEKGYSFETEYIPIYEGHNIDKETFFNLSLEYKNVLTADEITQIREVMHKNAKNNIIVLYNTNFISACLVPSRW